MSYSEQLAAIGTHGLLDLSTCKVHASSERTDWSSIYVSCQTEQPFSYSAPQRPLGLFVVHMNGPVEVTSRFGGRNRSSLVPSGAVTYWPPCHDFEVETLGQLKTIHLYINPAVINDSARQFGLDSFNAAEMSPIFGEPDELLRGLVVEAADFANEAQSGTALYADQIAQTLASRLIYRGLSPSRRSPVGGPGAFSGRQMKLLSEYISENIEGRILIQDLADLVGYSPSHFTRTFSKTTGTSPYQFVLNMRIEASKNLLQASDRPIIDIALDCGFASQEHFSRAFRKYSGSTPMSYRKASRF
jgi:AraC family transcriptional regulator